MSGVAALLADTAARHAQRPALRFGEAVVGYGELDDAAARCARMLRDAGVRPGDRVVLMLPNVPAFPIAYHAVLRLGAIVVPLNPLLKGREVEFVVRDTDARALVAWHELPAETVAPAAAAGASVLLVQPEELSARLAQTEATAPAVGADGGDTAVIIYTSGTTGVPKGAELTHDNLVRNARASVELFRLEPGDVVFGGLPLFHSFGQTCTLNAGVAAGATLTLLPRFDAREALRMLAAHDVSVFAGVPTMYTALLAADGGRVPGGRLRLAISGGASLPVAVLNTVEETLGCVLLEGYGLSETSPVASFNRIDGPRKPGSIGVPIEGVEMKVVDEDDRDLPAGEVGEIAIRGHNVMKGYWRRTEATAEAMRGGWFHSGDLARVDEDGCFFIVDRKKDLIIRGGYNVYPREVEEVLHEHPAVREAAVYGVAEERLGQEVAAAVVVDPDAGVAVGELREFVRERIAAYKYPRIVRLVDELPKGPSGKVLKRELGG
jgi:long-chain acyl-CoA synthetase